MNFKALLDLHKTLSVSLQWRIQNFPEWEWASILKGEGVEGLCANLLFWPFSRILQHEIEKNAPRGGGDRHKRPLGSANALSIHFVLIGCWVKYGVSFKNNKTNNEVEQRFIKLKNLIRKKLFTEL